MNLRRLGAVARKESLHIRRDPRSLILAVGIPMLMLLMFGYAFFKFAWAYRLFNYTAILIGATPARSFPDKQARTHMVRRAGSMSIVAGTHFTRGQRAFFFALAYLGWFLGPWAFLVSTAGVLMVMGKRQFSSDARRALEEVDPA